ncbi:HyaD/HybD family hydrogenase maturation endopeptidase [Candidatus Methylospira mobilis]|uniref:HyaD/HybD family hydrogenase maturation endopeptidase n=1 Tax=Candidatus Methylospira mobilis TaxID=1808979 RepID=A0A5Q0BRJ9_9GAMM|nr:HyaD/HybD family hydrogenase maturation endopeptidase [Candidatus Methylospira mobilis]QFY44824.1 HyaD/HybD family hydrogenase maturation endopeptidase [Candidatus Methylospira mobilis]WNV05632.1 HyaD/HybD family hydrogenase maturation endopeptidase [Candidatus Methylospira mobilis]
MTEKILILGIGNILWADEGFGVRAVQALQQGFDFPENVSLVDGGTQGLGLIPYVQEADTLVILDAVDFHLPPGSLVELSNDAVPAYFGAKKMSLHQVSFQEVLALSELLGKRPENLYLVGVQPELLEDYGGSLTATVRAQLEPAMQRVLAYLQTHAISARRKQEDPGVSGDALALANYELQRPAPDAACRIGDARFLNLREAGHSCA